MKKKVKVLIAHSKNQKQKTSNVPKGTLRFEDFIEREAPDMYEFIVGYGEEDILNQVDKNQPEIIYINQNKSMDALGLLKKIKRLHPTVAIFIFLRDIFGDEQETIDEYMVAGAYKCFLQPLSILTIIHDMYIALNLE